MNLILSIFFSFFLMLANQQNPWIAPESADKLVNPIKNNEESIIKGEKIFKNTCWTCHGNSGNGDGPAAAALKPKPAKFTSDIVQNQSDGALFWKLSEGRGKMSSYKMNLTTEQRWQLVNFIRTLKK
jgi:mono/diheme cytochrome c family protein